jgi:DNA-binding protein H-NS
MRQEQYSKAVTDAQNIITSFDIKAADLVFSSTKVSKAKSEKSENLKSSGKAKVKFSDTQGHEWSGRGLKPRWLTAALANGKSLEDFAVAPVQV